MVVPVDVFEGGEGGVVQVSPGSPLVDQFSLVETDSGLCQGVDAPIVKFWVLGGGSGVFSGFVVGHDALVGLAGEEAFQAADDVLF